MRSNTSLKSATSCVPNPVSGSRFVLNYERPFEYLLILSREQARKDIGVRSSSCDDDKAIWPDRIILCIRSIQTKADVDDQTYFIMHA